MNSPSPHNEAPPTGNKHPDDFHDAISDARLFERPRSRLHKRRERQRPQLIVALLALAIAISVGAVMFVNHRASTWDAQAEAQSATISRSLLASVPTQVEPARPSTLHSAASAYAYDERQFKGCFSAGNRCNCIDRNGSTVNLPPEQCKQYLADAPNVNAFRARPSSRPQRTAERVTYDSASTYVYTTPGTSAVDTKKAACEQARAYEKQYLDRYGNKAGFDIRRQLSDRVNEACY